MSFVSTEQDGFVAVVTIDHPPVNALSAPLLVELEEDIDRLDADDSVRALPCPEERATARSSRARHLGVPGAARGRGGSARVRLGARDPEARRPDGQGPHAVRRRDPRLLPRRRPRARHVLRRPHRLRGRAARAAGDQARAHPQAAAGRSGCRGWWGSAGAAHEHDRRVRGRENGVRLGARREGRPARGVARGGASGSQSRSPRSRRSRSGCSASSRGRRAISRSRKACAARRRASAAVSLRRTERRAWPRSSKSARRSSGAGEPPSSLPRRRSPSRQVTTCNLVRPSQLAIRIAIVGIAFSSAPFAQVTSCNLVAFWDMSPGSVAVT